MTTEKAIKRNSDLTPEERRAIGVWETPTDNGFFNTRTPLLKQGLTTNTIAKTDHLRITMKVYADGGENEMHSHDAEDHAFVVLSGEATFHIGSDENVRVIGKNDGVLLKAGEQYWFQSTGPNLVMLRVSASIPELKDKLGPGKDISFVPEWIALEGKFYPDDCD